MRKLQAILFLLSISFASFGQTYKQYVKEADLSLFTHKDYYNAMNFYAKALEFPAADSLRIAYHLAESARQFGSLETASKHYGLVKDLDSNNEYPLAPFYHGEVLTRQSKYQEAKMQYELYKSEQSGEDSSMDELVDRRLKLAEWAPNQDQDDSKVERLGDEINTNFHEVAPLMEEDGVIFSSMRTPPVCCPEEYPLAHGKIYRSSIGGITDVFSTELDKVDTTTSFLAYNTRRNMVIYSVCHHMNTTEVRCALYSRDIQGDQLGPEQRLPDPINLEGYTATHPNIGYDEAGRREILFFISDRPGTESSKGDLDLWYAVMNVDGSYGEPIRLSHLNTNEDESSPFFHNKTQQLFFSSKGYSDGYGGFDIRRAFRSSDPNQLASHTEASLGLTQSANLSRPRNSAHDDLFYSETPDGTTGWFSSNRNEAMEIDTTYDACCFDIFESQSPICEIPMNLLATVCDCGEEINNVSFVVTDLERGTEIAMEDGVYRVPKGQRINITASHPLYTEKSENLIVPSDIECGSPFEKEICLEPKSFELELSTWLCPSCEDPTDPIAMNNPTVILQNLTTGEEWKPQLGTPGNVVVFTDLVPCNDYRTITSVEDDCVDTSEVFKIIPDNSSLRMTKRICFERHETDMINLYFENDFPLGQTGDTESDFDYTDLYDRFNTDRNEALYTRRFSGGNHPLSRDVRRAMVDSFFNVEVETGYNQFLEFAKNLKGELEANPQKLIYLYIEGHASRIWQDDYNISLSFRRIDAVWRELQAIIGPELFSRVNADTQSFGESMNPESVSDSQVDTKNSVYNPDAARWRRVSLRRSRVSCNSCQN